MLKACGIYSITNIVNGKRYIGSTRRPFAARWKEHRTELRAAKHWNTHLQNSWNKYGEKAFQFEVLERIDVPEQIEAREQYWIDFYGGSASDCLYNICPNAYSPRERVVSSETRARLSESAKRMFSNPVTRQRHSEGISRAYSSPEGKRKASLKAKKQWQSQESRRRVSESAKKYGSDPEVRRRRAESTAQMMSDSVRRMEAAERTRARMNSPEGKRQIQLGNQKRWSDPEAKEKHAKRMVEQWASAEYRQSQVNRLAKTYDGFVSPDGTIYRNIVNLKEFCACHGLADSAMHNVYRGKRKSHKGWTRYFPEDTNV